VLCEGAQKHTSVACDSASQSLTWEPGSDIYIYIYIYTYIISQSPARDTPNTDEFDSLEPEPSWTRQTRTCMGNFTVVFSFELRFHVYGLIKNLLPCQISYIHEKKRL
jgi:hypothetical protein